MQKVLTKNEIEDAMRTSKKFSVAKNLRLERGANDWYWNVDFSFNRKRGTHRIGQYSKDSLEFALQKVAAYQALIDEGKDPVQLKHEAKNAGVEKGAPLELRKFEVLHPRSFKSISQKWLEAQKSRWSVKHYEKTQGRINNHLIPVLGHKLVNEINASDVKKACQKLVDEKKLGSAHDVAGICKRVFISAQTSNYITHNPCLSVIDELPPATQDNYAAQIKPKPLSKILQKMYAYQGTKVVQLALKLLPLLLVRPGNLRSAEWKEIDLRNGLWLIPPAKMKASQTKKLKGLPHVVPLSRQAVSILSDLYRLTGTEKFLFPHRHDESKCMSESTINSALVRMGISTTQEQTAHGFRATGRTMLEGVLSEQRHLIELQLDHTITDQNGTAYNRAELVRERKKMMQVWSDYVDRLLVGDLGNYYDVEEEFTSVTECEEFVSDVQQVNNLVQARSSEQIILTMAKHSLWDEWMDCVFSPESLSCSSSSQPQGLRALGANRCNFMRN